MRAGNYKDNLLGSSEGSSSSAAVEGEEASGEDRHMGEAASSKETTPPSEPEQKGKGKGKEQVKTFFGFDEDDEFMSSDEESEDGSTKK
jgi:hypothetical protein